MNFLKALGLYGHKHKEESIALRFHNTLSGETEVFVPKMRDRVLMYNCGPTVYDYPHIGNFRSFIFADTLKRVLLYNGFGVDQVINLTDVGHLTSNADEGEDKIEKKAKETGERAEDIIERGISTFFRDIEKLNLNTDSTKFPKASDHIDKQIILIRTLEEKGYTYKTSDGIYFNSSLFKEYGKLGNIKLESLKEGARVRQNPEKKNPADFALWKFSKLDEDRQQEWDSPWGIGFPGWHIECSAMAITILGRQIDIHTGGIDHIPIHHNNEIAQSESATGMRFSRYWMHNAFLTMNGSKISKSVGNTILLSDIEKRGLHPLSLRYWFLTGHYRTTMNFTWDAITGAEKALMRLYRFITDTRANGVVIDSYQQKFHEAINNDMDTPRVLAMIWDMIKADKLKREDIAATLKKFDKVLGLRLNTIEKTQFENEKEIQVDQIPTAVLKLVADRETARKMKNWKEADRLRDEIAERGYQIHDTAEKSILSRMHGGK